MTEVALVLSRCCTDPNTITFNDERDRSGDAPNAAIASVTLDGPDSSWGEFMERRDLLAVRAGIDRFLRRA